MKNLNFQQSPNPKNSAMVLFYFGCVIVLCIIFTSCGTLIKRHYMKGYYVDNKKHNTTSAVVKNKTIDEQTYAIVNHKKEVLATELSALNDKTVSGFLVQKYSDIKITKAKNEHLALIKNVKKETANEEVAVTKTKSNSFTMRGIAQKIAEPEAGLVGAVFSLFWIVILIIFAAYIIALFAIADIGSAAWIHILGIVALALLILWLLKIV